jgi:hypothetical protein
VINLSDTYVISNNLTISSIRAISFKCQLLTTAKNGNDVLENEITHIHTLVAECTIDKDGKQKPFSYFNYEQLRKSFMKQLLDRIQSFLFTKGDKTEIDHFIKLKVYLYKTYGKGFYVKSKR